MVLGGLILGLTGCARHGFFGATPVIEKQAKRAYNKPYHIKGKRYHPQSLYEYSQTGIASYYGGRDIFHGRTTSTGEIFNKNGLTAAHKTLPLPSVVRVTNLKNGRTIKLRINDRGPFVRGRIIDVSEKAARLLGFHHDGVTKVRVDCLVGESLHLGQHYNPKKCNPYTVYGHYPQGRSRISVRDMVNKRLSHAGQKDKNDAPKQKGISVYQAQDLQTKSVADIKSIRSVLPRGTYIQVGTYESPLNAQNFAYKVQTRMRTPCTTYGFENAGKTAYRVLMGPMISKKTTEQMLHELKIRNVTDAFVVVQK